MMRFLRAVGPVAGLGGLIYWVVFGKIFEASERPSWPPGPDAVPADGTMAAVEAFDANPSPVPSSVDLSYAWTTSSTIEPLAGGAEFYPRILADAEAATSSIHILMFGWKPGEPAGRLTDILVAKLRAGIEVRILVDSFGSRPNGLSADMYGRLADAGAEIVVNSFLPPRHEGLYPHTRVGWGYSLPARADHRKLFVIDGRIAWTGGAGIEDHFADGRFHDVMVRVTGDVVRQAQAVFLTSFRSHRAPLPDDLAPFFPAPVDPGAIPTALVQVVPRGFVSATQSTRELLDGTTRRLDIMNPYLTEGEMIDRIIGAARRGARVRVVVSAKSNNLLASEALRHRYREMESAGVEVWEYPGAVVHAKVIIADDTVQFGTVNLDAWALYRNFEIAMMARDADTAEEFEREIFEPAIARSHPARPAEGLAQEALGRVANKLTYFL